jgi:hypothetical protein
MIAWTLAITCPRPQSNQRTRLYIDASSSHRRELVANTAIPTQRRSCSASEVRVRRRGSGRAHLQATLHRHHPHHRDIAPELIVDDQRNAHHEIQAAALLARV